MEHHKTLVIPTDLGIYDGIECESSGRRIKLLFFSSLYSQKFNDEHKLPMLFDIVRKTNSIYQISFSYHFNSIDNNYN